MCIPTNANFKSSHSIPVTRIARPDEEAGGGPDHRGETSSSLGAHDHGTGKCLEWDLFCHLFFPTKFLD